MIETEYLKLIPCDREMLRSAMEGDGQLSQQLGMTVAEGWLNIERTSLQDVYQKLEEDSEKNWWIYLAIDKTENTVIGSGGFKGKPDEKGVVEISYEISPHYRGNDFATETLETLVEYAFQQVEVKIITSYTLGELNRYAKVLLSCGFKRVERIKDTGEGIMWRWQLKR